MTLEELIAEVQTVIQDSAFTDSMITSTLNRGMQTITKGVILPGRYQVTPPLPDLYTIDTIDTNLGSGVCDLPTDFNRNLIQVLNADKKSIEIYSSFLKFINDNPEQNDGAVRIVTQHGNRLLYRDIPSVAETLTVHYYASPTELVVSTDKPDVIPEALQKPLLVGFACADIFNVIEDGIEGQKINTAFWNNEYQQGLIQLEIEIGFDAEPDYYEDFTVRID